MKKEEFISLLRERGLFLTENQVSQFEKYLYLIQEHNKVMNLTGITEDGRFLVNDPYGPNYRPARCIKGFNEGFKEWEILIGLCGGWIFEAKEDNIAEELNKIDESIEIENQKIQNLLVSEII